MKENAEKLRALDSAELATKLNEGAETAFRLRFQMSMGQTDGVKKLRGLRKERARILTIFKQRGEEAPQLTAPVAKKGASTKGAKTASKKTAKTKKDAKG